MVFPYPIVIVKLQLRAELPSMVLPPFSFILFFYLLVQYTQKIRESQPGVFLPRGTVCFSPGGQRVFYNVPIDVDIKFDPNPISWTLKIPLILFHGHLLILLSG